MLLLQPSFAQLVARIRRISEAGPVSFVPLVPRSALVLATGTFVFSWKERMVFMVSALVTTGFLAVITLPGSTLEVIVGLDIFWALSCKSIRRARASFVTALNR